MRDRAHARNSDPITSFLAADSVRALRPSQQKIVDALAARGPMTDEQIFALDLGMSPSGTRSRRSELVERGLVIDSGLRATTKANRATIIWKVAQPATAQLRLL